MTPAQYKKHLADAELTIVGAAPYLGISRRQSQRLAAGDAPIPDPVAKLLKLIATEKIKKEDLL
jgi:hypothetical protein